MTQIFLHDMSTDSRTESIPDRRIDNMPDPFFLASTPYRVDTFSPKTRETVRFLTESLSMTKVIFAGDIGVGKTSMINRFSRQTFEDTYKATIGTDMVVERFDILHVSYHMQIWDTAGQERYKALNLSYYRGANAIVLVFDLDKVETMISIRSWLEEASEVNPDIPLRFIVGNKRDILPLRCYHPIEDEAILLAKKLKAEYWSVSSKSGENINKFFHRLASLTFDNIILQDYKEAHAFHNIVTAKKTSRCSGMCTI